MLGIFGEPNFVTDHYRPTTKGTYEDGSRWKGGYWWKFKAERFPQLVVVRSKPVFETSRW